MDPHSPFPIEVYDGSNPDEPIPHVLTAAGEGVDMRGMLPAESDFAACGCAGCRPVPPPSEAS